jgi:hypothetical protein
MVEELSMVIHASKVSAVGRRICLKLKDIIPRQLVEVYLCSLWLIIIHKKELIVSLAAVLIYDYKCTYLAHSESDIETSVENQLTYRAEAFLRSCQLCSHS